MEYAFSGTGKTRAILDIAMQNKGALEYTSLILYLFLLLNKIKNAITYSQLNGGQELIAQIKNYYL